MRLAVGHQAVALGGERRLGDAVRRVIEEVVNAGLCVRFQVVEPLGGECIGPEIVVVRAGCHLVSSAQIRGLLCEVAAKLRLCRGSNNSLDEPEAKHHDEDDNEQYYDYERYV